MAQSFRETLDEFLDQTINPGESLPTRIELVPECETKATVSDIQLRKFQNQDTGEWRAVVEMMFTINDHAIKEETGLEEPRARYSLFLDTPKDWDGNGTPPLEFGRNKNVGLGRLLEGFGMNSGKSFKWSQFMHEDAWIRVGKPRNPEQAMYADVAAIGQHEDDVKRPSARRK